MATTSLISIPEGTRIRQPLAFVDASGTAINLATVTTLTFYVFREATTIITATEANSKLSITTAASGLARLDLEIADTTGKNGEYKYEAWGIIGGVNQLLGRGPFYITETYTG